MAAHISHNLSLESLALESPDEKFYVIHPLDAPLEEKCSTEGLGPMELTRPVRASLLVLRIYLIAITLVLLYRTLDLAHLLQHHV